MIRLYRVEKLSKEDDHHYGLPVPAVEAAKEVGSRIPHLGNGELLRVRAIDYSLDPYHPITAATPAMREVWKGIVLNYPSVGTLGVYVCKPDSQHRFGNAGDWAAEQAAKTTEEIVAYLWKVANFARAQGIDFEDTRGKTGLPVSEVIFRDKIATRAHDWTWRSYTGVFHAAHVHTSAYPLVLPYSLPCGVPPS